jgi:hypothetical protein
LLSENRLLSGQNYGYLNIVELSDLKSIGGCKLEQSGDINDMTVTRDEGIYAIACVSGLYIF